MFCYECTESDLSLCPGQNLFKDNKQKQKNTPPSHKKIILKWIAEMFLSYAYHL